MFADAPPPDETPPEVAIESPKADAEFPADAARITVACTIVEEESGVMEAVLKVDGKAVSTLDEEPWTFRDVALEPGEHTLVVSASNYDSSGHSDPVKVTVAEPKPKPEPDTKTDVESEAKSDKPETKSDKPEKKGCRVSPSRPAWSTAGLALRLRP